MCDSSMLKKDIHSIVKPFKTSVSSGLLVCSETPNRLSKQRSRQKPEKLDIPAMAASIATQVAAVFRL